MVSLRLPSFLALAGLILIIIPASRDAHVDVDNPRPVVKFQELTPVGNNCIDCHPRPFQDLPKLSNFRSQYYAEPIDNCLDCHDPDELSSLATNWTHPARSLSTHYFCTDCHQDIAHGKNAAMPDAVLPNVKECFSCHGEIESRLNRMFSHGRDPRIDCFDCHPPHGKLDVAIPKTLLSTGDSDKWRGGYDWWTSNQLCLDCHIPSNLVSSLTEGFVTLNTINYHDLHVFNGEVMCIECHDPHGSSQQAMIRDQLITGEYFGYYQEPDGASCTIRCHGVDHHDWRYINQAR